MLLHWKTASCALPLLALTSFLFPGVAEAHAVFASAEPAPGQQLSTAPGVVLLRFSEPINTKLSRATVAGPGGARGQGAAIGPQEIQVPVITKAPGVYTVDWTTVSLVDGHTLHGQFRFGVQVAPGEGAEGSTAFAPQPADLLVAAARALEYTGLLLAVGMLLLRHLAARNPPLVWVRCRPILPLTVALLCGVAVVAGEALAAAPSPSAWALVDYLGSGPAGAARLGRLAAEALAQYVALFNPMLAAVPLSLALIGLAATGHAAASRPAWWGIAVDAGHLGAAGLWAGGIVALATLRPPGGWRGAEGMKLLRRFSPIALAAFVMTVAFGAVRSLQELESLDDLITSSYGQILLAKMLIVVWMVPLSFLAWRRRSVAPRIEASLAIIAIIAAALLAAHPLPPARAGEAEAEAERPETASETDVATSAVPVAGDLTFADAAGGTLVGLTVRPGQPGRNQLLLYLIPPRGDSAAAGTPATLSVAGQTLELHRCGPACRVAEADLEGGETLEVGVDGPQSGATVFHVPPLPVPDGMEMVRQMRQRMHQLQRLRVDEALGPVDRPVRATFAFQVPNRMRSLVESRSETIWIGPTRYTRETPAGAWKAEQVGVSLPVPAYTWGAPGDPEPTTARVLGTDTVDGVDVQVVSFFMQSDRLPTWFLAWIGPDSLAYRARMWARGHVMEDRYYDFDAPFSIEPPGD